MIKDSVVILGRQDMLQSKRGKSIVLINIGDFTVDVSSDDRPMQTNGVVLFVDEKNGQTKIIKNRYGDHGNGMFVDTIKSMKENSQDNNLGYGKEYFNDIIDLYEGKF